MTVSATVTALQALHATITGVTTAPTIMPGSLNNAQLPMALTFPGPGSWRNEAVGLIQHRRRYIVRVYVAPLSLGRTIDEGYQAGIPLLQAFGEAYLAVTTLGGAIAHLGTLEGGSLATDEGLGVLVFAGIEYHGFTFFVDVIEKGS